MSRPLRIILILGLINLVLLTIYYGHTDKQLSNTKIVVSSRLSEIGEEKALEEEKTKWSARTDAVGASQAYKEFLEVYKDEHFGIQHTFAHMMGQMLFEKLGLDGLTVCDSTFAFGCYHSFFGQALISYGVSVVKQLDEVCTQTYGPYGTGCQHGIGHGLLEYFGHKQLAKALEACSLTIKVSPLSGCSSGVFMEYNFPTVIDENSTTAQTRAIDFSKPYDPCPNMSNEYRPACYNGLAQWWSRGALYNGDYQKMGELCHKIEEANDRDVCFLGIGAIAAPSSNYVVVDTLAKCQKMPESGEQIFCRAGASWGFFASPEHREMAGTLCEGISQLSSGRCIHGRDLVGIPNI